MSGGERPAVLVTDVRGFANPVIAARLASAGARVMGADPEILADAAEGALEVLAWDAPHRLVETAAARCAGRLDAIVIAPATPAPRTPLDSLDAEILRPFFERLAIEALAFAGAASRVMKAQGGGRIVFATSSGPIGGIPGYAAYAAARAAINGSVRSLALELAPFGISVNAVAPNFIQTETYYPRALLEDPVKRAKLLGRIPMGRLGEAEEVAAIVELLALGRSGFLSGQVIPVSGAWC
jgi:NAD(P)-dependent dehydrogenase (short-subunit alcohol dehydrogenase family)